MEIKPLIQNRNLRIAGKGMLPALGLFSLFLACTALVLKSFSTLLPAASLHLFLGLGVLPLILGAMAHFIPVLTRTAPRAGDHRPALLGLVAGLLAISGQQFWFPLIFPAAALGMAAGIDLLLIAQRRARDCIGAPHPCLRWYQAALACLVLALAAHEETVIVEGGARRATLIRDFPPSLDQSAPTSPAPQSAGLCRDHRGGYFTGAAPHSGRLHRPGQRCAPTEGY